MLEETNVFGGMIVGTMLGLLLLQRSKMNRHRAEAERLSVHLRQVTARAL